MNKKFAIMEREMVEEYLQLQEQYVRQTATIFNLWKNVFSTDCLFKYTKSFTIITEEGEIAI